MNDLSTLTLCGNIGTDPRTFTTARGVRGLSFRLGVTAYRVTDAGAFQSLDTRWYTVRAFDKLAENLLHSAHKGQPVVVVGRPGVNAWKDEGGEVRSELQVTASHVGLDLKYGTGHFWRTPRPSEPAVVDGQEVDGDAAALTDSGGASTRDTGGAGGYGGETPTADPGGATDEDSPVDVLLDGVLTEERSSDPDAGGDGQGAFAAQYAPF